MYVRQPCWTQLARVAVGARAALLRGRLRYGWTVQARGERHRRGPPRENAFSRRSAAGALRACGETCLGTADLALRHCTDPKAGEFKLGLAAGSRPELWHRTDSARHAAVSEPPSGNSDSNADRKIDSCGSRGAGVRGRNRLGRASRSFVRGRADIVLPPYDAAARTQDGSLAIPCALDFHTRSWRVGSCSSSQSFVSSLSLGASRAACIEIRARITERNKERTLGVTIKSCRVRVWQQASRGGLRDGETEAAIHSKDR